MGVLANALMAKGYNETDALNAERLDDGSLAQEYLGGSSGGSNDGGGSNGTTNSSGNVPKFEFDQDQANKDAMEELRPYYEKLLKIYNGDIAMAKQRMEQDYKRGLRYSREDTQTGLDGIAETKEERARRFDIALGDLDQEMNTRGIYNSGIKDQEVDVSKAGEKYQVGLLDRDAEALRTAETRYKEKAETTLNRYNEDMGHNASGVEGFMSEPEKYKWEQSKKMAEEGAEMANTRRYQRYQDWYTGASPIATANPSTWADNLDTALELSGLPKVS